ncbi:Talin-2, partial [Ophiophagus hannah]
MERVLLSLLILDKKDENQKEGYLFFCLVQFDCLNEDWERNGRNLALDGDFSEENRGKCRTAAAPLIEAVENLTAFASNPEFASIPAQISAEGSRAQEPILASARTMLESSSFLIKTARSLAINPKDPNTWSVLAGHSHTVSESIKSLITSIRCSSPPSSPA